MGRIAALADIFSANDPYENEPRFRTWLGYVIAERGGAPALGYDTADVHQTINWAPDLMRGYDLRKLDDCFETLTAIWKSLDDELHENTEMVKVIFDGWEAEAKAAAAGYLGSVIDVVRQECNALTPLANVLINFYAYILSARKKINSLMGIFCDMCADKYADAASEDEMEHVTAKFEQFIITVSVGILATVGTGGTAFPVVVGALGGVVADEISKLKDQEATAPADDWSDIVDWYLARCRELAEQLDEGLADITRQAKSVEHPEIGRLAEIDEQYLPTRRRSAAVLGLPSPATPSAPLGEITSRLDGAADDGQPA